MKNKLRMAILAFTLMALNACVMSPPTGGVPDMTFAQVQPIMVNAQRLEIVDGYQSPMQAPNVEHLFKIPPASAARALVQKQVMAQGGENILRVTIENASVVERVLPVAGGFQGMLTREPARQYDGKFAIRFEMVSPSAPDIVKAHARVTATRTTGVGENASPADRDRAFFTLTEKMMNDVSEGIRTTVYNTLSRY